MANKSHDPFIEYLSGGVEAFDAARSQSAPPFGANSTAFPLSVNQDREARLRAEQQTAPVASTAAPKASRSEWKAQLTEKLRENPGRAQDVLDAATAAVYELDPDENVPFAHLLDDEDGE